MKTLHEYLCRPSRCHQLKGNTLKWQKKKHFFTTFRCKFRFRSECVKEGKVKNIPTSILPLCICPNFSSTLKCWMQLDLSPFLQDNRSRPKKICIPFDFNIQSALNGNFDSIEPYTWQSQSIWPANGRAANQSTIKAI